MPRKAQPRKVWNKGTMGQLKAIAEAPADDGELLDANGPGRLGADSEIGRVVLSGRGARRVDGAGLDIGFRLS